MKNRQIVVRMSDAEFGMLNSIVEKRGQPISDVIRALIIAENDNDMLKQILMNTSILRCGFSAHMNADEKTKTAELWATEKVKLGVE
jgi:hypothetical protein